MKKNISLAIGLVMVLVLCLGAVACDKWNVWARQTIIGSYETWNKIQDILIAEHEAGRISDADWVKVRDLDTKYRATHNTALVAVVEYEILTDAAQKNKKQLIIQLIDDLAGLIAQAYELMDAWHIKRPI